LQTKKYDVIVVGELNVDLILNGIEGEVEIGKEILAREMELVMGSSSAIFACNLSTLGANVAFLGKIGTDVFGDLIKSSLEKKGIDSSFVEVDESYKTGATIALNYDNDRAMVTHMGAMEELSFGDITEEKLMTARHMHISSPFLQPKIKENIIEIFKLAKELGLTTSLDPQWDPAEKWDINLEQLLPYVDIFLPNEEEIKGLTKTKTIEDAVNVLNQINKNATIIKQGTKGSLLLKDGEVRHLDALINDDFVDAIGAGDSFDAGVVKKFIDGASLEECQNFGNITGAINTTAVGGTGAFDSLENIEKKIELLLNANK